MDIPNTRWIIPNLHQMIKIASYKDVINVAKQRLVAAIK
jgi:hypothetical protein